jgi:hypothetical protein
MVEVPNRRSILLLTTVKRTNLLPGVSILR